MLTCSSITRDVAGPAGTITLEETARHRRRVVMRSDNTDGTGGIEFLLDLPQARLLRHGDGLLLSSEPNASFEFVLAPRAFDPTQDQIDLSPLGRLVAPGGSLAVSTASGSALASVLSDRLKSCLSEGVKVRLLERAGITLALAKRPN